MDNLSFSQPINNRSGGKNVYFKDKLTTTLVGKIPFGIQTYNFNKVCDLQIEDDKCISYLENLNKFIVDNATSNSMKWFNKSIHPSVIAELYKSPLRKNNNFPPLLKLKLSNKHNLNLDNVVKGCQVEVEIENTGLYFTSSSFGTGWIINNITVIQQAEKQLSGYSFVDDE